MLLHWFDTRGGVILRIVDRRVPLLTVAFLIIILDNSLVSLLGMRLSGEDAGPFCPRRSCSPSNVQLVTIPSSSPIMLPARPFAATNAKLSSLFPNGLSQVNQSIPATPAPQNYQRRSRPKDGCFRARLLIGDKNEPFA